MKFRSIGSKSGNAPNRKGRLRIGSASIEGPAAAPLRVLHVITSLGNGGAEGFLFRLCESDRDSSHVVVSLTDKGRYGTPLREIGVTVHEVKGSKHWFGILRFLALVRIIKSERPDIVQTWLPHSDLLASIAAKIAGVPRIYWSIRSEGYGPGMSSARTKFVVGLLALLARSIPHGIISCSEAAKNSHVKRGYPADLIDVVPNGYYTGISVKSEAFRSQKFFPDVPKDTRLVGMVARFALQKDFRTLFQAIKVLSENRNDFLFVVCGPGSGPSDGQIHGLANYADISEKLLFLGEQSDVSEIMASLDIHVLSSAFGEGFPNVVAESMLLGVPNVVTDVGDAPLIVGPTGWVVPPKNPRAIAQAIDEALTMEPAALRRRGLAARNRVLSRYGLSKVRKKYGAIYRRQKLLVLPRYGSDGASSRVRFEQYFPHLAKRGFSTMSHSFFSDRYLGLRYGGQFFGIEVVRSYARRVWALVRNRDADIFWVEKELFPWVPWNLEKCFYPRKSRVIVDYDDASYLLYESHQWKLVRATLGNKMAKMADWTSLTVVGNDFLARWFLSKSSGEVIVIPSTVRLKKGTAPEKSSSQTRKPVFGWIGTPVTWTKYVAPHLRFFEELAVTNNAEFWIIGSGVMPDDTGGSLCFFEWDEENLDSLLNQFDVGVMPLSVGPWENGKCGYKLLQYMAHGKAVVASPVGVNSQIVEHGVNGFLASSHDEWRFALSHLLRHPEERNRLGESGYETVAARFDLEKWGVKLAREFQGLNSVT